VEAEQAGWKLSRQGQKLSRQGQKQYSVVAIGVEYGTSSRALGLSVQQVIQASQNKLGTYTRDRFVRKRSLPFHLPDDPIIKKIALHLEHSNMSQTALNLVAISVLYSPFHSAGTFIEFVPGSTRDRYFPLLGIATLDSFSLQGKGGTLLWIG